MRLKKTNSLSVEEDNERGSVEKKYGIKKHVISDTEEEMDSEYEERNEVEESANFNDEIDENTNIPLKDKYEAL